MTYAPTGGLVAAPTAGAARAGRRRAQLGLPLHLGPRRLVLGATRCSGWASSRRPRAFGALAARPGRASSVGSDSGAAEHHVPGRRLLRPQGGDPRPLGGLPRLAPGADRQRRRRPAAARHLRRGAGQHLRRRTRHGLAGRPPRAGLAIRDVLDWLADNWDQPEEGIWETRGGRKDFTYGRVMCWVAFDRGIRLAAEHGPPRAAGALDEPSATRSTTQVMDAGLERRAGRPSCSTTTTDVLDSSLLRMPHGRVHRAARPDVALDPATPWTTSSSPTAWSTATTPSASPDGLRGSEGTFSLCTFTYVDALARAGRLDEARLTFEKMLTYANHVGLYSEEIAPDRRADRQLPAGVHPPRAHRRRASPSTPRWTASAAGPRHSSRQGRRPSTCPPWRCLGGRPRRFRWPVAGRDERGGARIRAGSSPSSLAQPPPPDEASLHRDEESPGRRHQCGGWKGEPC